MKSAKVILTLSTCTLAVAGIAATTAKKVVANAKIRNAAGQCVLYTTNCTNTGQITCKTAANLVRTVYTIANNCVNKIHYATQSDLK